MGLSWVHARSLCYQNGLNSWSPILVVHALLVYQVVHWPVLPGVTEKNKKEINNDR